MLFIFIELYLSILLITFIYLVENLCVIQRLLYVIYVSCNLLISLVSKLLHNRILMTIIVI